MVFFFSLLLLFFFKQGTDDIKERSSHFFALLSVSVPVRSDARRRTGTTGLRTPTLPEG